MRLEKLRIVAQGETNLGPLLWHINQMPRADQLLDFMIKSRLTGFELLAFSRFYFGMSILKVIEEITRRMERGEAPRPVILGRDIVL